MGYCGVSVVGYGTLTLENSRFYADRMIALRNDYGSTWDGNIVIKNCEFTPTSAGNPSLIFLKNPENHDFGYTCYAPRMIEIDGLRVYSSNQIYVMANPNSEHQTADYSPAFPYVPSEKVSIKNFKSNGKKAPLLSPNTVFFRDTEFTVQ